VRLEADGLDVALWYAWACGFVFLIGYSWITPWWERRPGWVASLHGVADLLFTTPFVLHFIWRGVGQASWFGWYFAFSFFVAGSIELLRLWLVWTLNRRRTPDA
jgi:hypothetical protein